MFRRRAPACAPVAHHVECPRTAGIAALTLLVVAAACPLGSPLTDGDGSDPTSPNDPNDDPGPTGPVFPPPATDATFAVGADDTLELVTWNVKNFPCGNSPNSLVCRPGSSGTAALVADLIESMDVDLLALQEIADTAAFEEVVARLPRHEGLLSTHQYSDGTYQKIGIVYRPDVLSVGTPALIFQFDPDFPRPGFQVPFSWVGPGGPVDFLAISVHLKAGETTEDFTRRSNAIAQMEGYARNLVDGAGADAIVFLGDFNENLKDPDGLENFQPFRDATRYTIRTQAVTNARQGTYLPSGAVIDHIVTTRAFDTAFGDAVAEIPRIDIDVEDYRERVSDHLPVALVVSPSAPAR